jgi:hypothetical protein
MAILTKQALTKAGAAVTFTAASTSDTIDLSGDAILLVTTATGASQVVTISCFPDLTEWNTAIPDLTYTAINSTTRAFYLTPANNASPSTGLCTVSTPTTTGLTYAVIAQ